LAIENVYELLQEQEAEYSSSKEKFRAVVLVDREEYNYADFAIQFMNHVIKKNQAPAPSSEPTQPPQVELQAAEWLKLRCLFDNNFEADSVVKQNVHEFEQIWTQLHGIDLFREHFEHHKYDYKCFGVQTVNGANDYKYGKINK
jgi:hypothetical protein